MIKGSKDPNAAFQAAAQQSTELAEVVNTVQNSGMSAKELFYQQAKAQGIDPNAILNLLR